MKLIIRKFLFLALILLSSCELSMMEYVVPEDQIGVDEPHTVVNEYGEFTYQYNDNVTPLNGEPQNYIVNMNDSVIWFMDNLPKKWIPKAGEYIAANCSLTIPLGLCSKVRSVTREAGTIRVEYEPSYEPTGPFGAKSMGELVINTPAPAIADAIHRATGLYFRTLPILPEHIAMALAEQKK